MFIRKELQIILDCLIFAEANMPKADDFDDKRLELLIKRSSEHIDYMCEECNGIGLVESQQCTTCDGTGINKKYGKAQKFFGAPEQLVTGQ